MNLSLTTRPAIVMVSPRSGSAFLTLHSSSPLSASSARTWPSSVVIRILPST